MSRRIILSATIEDIAKRKMYYVGNEIISEWIVLRAESEVNRLIRTMKLKYFAGKL